MKTTVRYRLRYAAEAAQRCWKRVQGARRTRSRGLLLAAAVAAALFATLLLCAAVPGSSLGESPLVVEYNASPLFPDADVNGDVDGLVEYDALSPGAGCSIPPSFAAPITNPFGLADVGTYSDPTFADLDADGDLDAFVGNGVGDIRYFQNTGSSSTLPFPLPLPTLSA